ncbi:hypothetical protein GCM10007320_29550 [Pseudorhodoferax aquiterrae]|uniref:Ku domain-containing protein n=2 Tax=Pseudorhodoferax aquiterrae TaxID=747304 RepID=A0ABQ3G2A0_9BURK|nr:hypothetical protein GCM10007320_29550 [Pseudorhodoferax aquiterrae]
MVKGYEVERDHFVLFSQDELKAREQASSHVIDTVAFIPEKTVDPLYNDGPELVPAQGATGAGDVLAHRRGLHG